MAKWVYLNDPDELPDPPRYGLRKRRTFPNGQATSWQFAIYPTLALVKAAITNDCGHRVQTQWEYRVYEWDDAAWQVIYDIPQDFIKLDHELWAKGPAPTHRQTINEDDVEAAIASIMNG